MAAWHPDLFSGVTNQGQLLTQQHCSALTSRMLAVPPGAAIDLQQTKSWSDKNSSVVERPVRSEQTAIAAARAVRPLPPTTEKELRRNHWRCHLARRHAISGPQFLPHGTPPGAISPLAASATGSVAASGAPDTRSSAPTTSDVLDMMSNPTTNFA